MDTILDTGHSWILDTIDYDNLSITIVLKELFCSSTVTNKNQGAPIDGCHSVKSNINSRAIEIKFNHFFTFQAVNESCYTEEQGIEFESQGFVSVVLNSKYLSFLKERYGWYECVSGEAKLYTVWSESEVLEVYTSQKPVIRVL